MATEVRTGEFKGRKMFEIWDNEATYGKDRPQISFGLRKAKMLIEHLEELQLFIAEQEGTDGK